VAAYVIRNGGSESDIMVSPARGGHTTSEAEEERKERERRKKEK